ncbi:hypothetical protein DVH24_024078 [Malus domestica]|uniref:Uncharacterized protein n=1 Tax=Malus domestica TaxID=3750 RepID=A0A498JKD5_MALDO|nr:hypothetical protein DVH24_024078 [Malus domestica]
MAMRRDESEVAHNFSVARVQVGQHVCVYCESPSCALWPGLGFIKPPTSPKQQVPRSSYSRKLRLGNNNGIKALFFNPNKEPILKEALKWTLPESAFFKRARLGPVPKFEISLLAPTRLVAFSYRSGLVSPNLGPAHAQP